MLFEREIRLWRVKCLRAWVDLPHFTLQSKLSLHIRLSVKVKWILDKLPL